MRSMFFVMMLVGSIAVDSPFNTYAVHLQHVAMSGGCFANDLDQFGNRTYRFRKTRMYPGDQPLTLRNGRGVERNPDGSIEWESVLHARPVELGKSPAVLLEILAVHVQGTGSITYLLVGRCRSTAMEVVLEVSGPLKDSTYTMADGLTITHYEWSANGCHACPSRQVTERYTWEDKRDRFVLANRLSRPVER
jgi:hypothetical protein